MGGLGSSAPPISDFRRALDPVARMSIAGGLGGFKGRLVQKPCSLKKLPIDNFTIREYFPHN